MTARLGLLEWTGQVVPSMPLPAYKHSIETLIAVHTAADSPLFNLLRVASAYIDSYTLRSALFATLEVGLVLGSLLQSLVCSIELR